MRSRGTPTPGRSRSAGISWSSSRTDSAPITVAWRPCWSACGHRYSDPTLGIALTRRELRQEWPVAVTAGCFPGRVEAADPRGIGGRCAGSGQRSGRPGLRYGFRILLASTVIPGPHRPARPPPLSQCHTPSQVLPVGHLCGQLARKVSRRAQLLRPERYRPRIPSRSPRWSPRHPPTSYRAIPRSCRPSRPPRAAPGHRCCPSCASNQSR